MAKIAVFFGGSSTEHSISILTGCFICKTLHTMGHSVKPILLTKDGGWVVPSEYRMSIPFEVSDSPDLFQEEFQKRYGVSRTNQIFSLDADIVFLGLHGGQGEDGTIQGFLEILGIPYTGSGVLASAIAMDKTRANQIFLQSGQKVAPFFEIDKLEYLDSTDAVITKLETLGFPQFLKPVEGGSSVSVYKITNREQLKEKLALIFESDSKVMSQSFLTGIEVSCGVLERYRDGKFKKIALPATEIVPGGEFFDFESKYKQGGSHEITPARISEQEMKRVQELAIAAHRSLGCSGYSRTDFIIVNGEPHILETNTLPGMTETSLIPQQAKAAGISMEEVFSDLIEIGLKRSLY
ncbi:D-alanine--D-alanine ligase [Leptospira interrogans]|uniref:D-alanine--D-alanine ligase n=1 Tax=Leptospira interrogans str. UI 12758 TaxID=1049938 RepID=A0A0E2D030_LEPIR|nr:D-alanine--D-alanine ligase [Leptospira interrogans]ASV06022.1 D-alanine--D-alanine ligase [Leptospira interrogans serovar Canicola]EKO68144.1 D-alanine--D-alanine ligase N-terminal domain protein [Leptospira interrogans serovar Canicola str. Fiocruz LV133]EKR53201.1 D-alanine--D-alanine ligase [Leptospira interrogans str. UI 12758]EMK22116.1 D-alanine--D-alanine ligase [Leptospira interrogans str. Kito]EMN75219.1 D-alanine--D-alanine ligase [Leptospira interrogans str. UI 09600]